MMWVLALTWRADSELTFVSCSQVRKEWENGTFEIVEGDEVRMQSARVCPPVFTCCPAGHSHGE